MSLIINKLHFEDENYIQDEKYYSVRLTEKIENYENDNEILKINSNKYLYSLSETPKIREFPISKKYKFVDCYRIKLKPNTFEKIDLSSILNLIIKSLINVKYISIYKLSEKNEMCELNEDEIENENEYILKSKFINMSLFYQLIYSICKKLKIDVIIMFDKYLAYKLNLNLNNDNIICSNEKAYNINDYKNIGNEYKNICDAYINDIKSELYIKNRNENEN
jgi:hypothetical protein